MQTHQPWHQKLAPVRVARTAVRRTFFTVLRKALGTDDGRAILEATLHGQLQWRPRTVFNDLNLNDRVYGELGGLSGPSTDREPIIITARFRTGSTALWNAFRTIPSCTSFYEPLNERRWFDPLQRGVMTDPTHRGVSEYWREYRGMEHLGQVYRDSWTWRDLYMDDTSWNPLLHEYVSQLIARAPGRPVLQFNEIDFRLPWFRTAFPTAKILHLYRHPREQWCSTLFSSYPFDAPLSAFEPHDHFYLGRWVQDLKFTFPFLDDGRVTHPYDQFYFLWKLSYLYGRAYAHRSLRFEHLADAAGPQLRAIFEWLGITDAPMDEIASMFSCPPPGRWKHYASADWFEARESRCETVLREFFACRASTASVDSEGAMWPALEAALSHRGLHEAAGGES